MHVNFGIVKNFGVYWTMALQPLNLAFFPRIPATAAMAGMSILTLTLVGFALHRALNGRVLVYQFAHERLIPEPDFVL